MASFEPRMLFKNVALMKLYTTMCPEDDDRLHPDFQSHYSISNVRSFSVLGALCILPAVIYKLAVTVT